VEAKLVRRGLGFELVAGHSGQKLDREAAATTIVRSLARLDRQAQVPLPVRLDRVTVTAADLAPAHRQALAAISAPVRLEYDGTRWKLPRWRIAKMLALPSGGTKTLTIGGPYADAWFEQLRKRVEHPPVNANFEVFPGGIRVVADKDGLGLDVPATAKSLLAAAVAPGARTAPLVVHTTKAERSLAEAQAMGITGVVGSYYTTYGGIANRLHNVALVANLIDGTLIAPGKTFSFNSTTGERTPEKGFLEAPVIINGELQTGLGGGVCQVSTTVFNAAYEAGLPITQRSNHALYISHYPLGRDATVNYPDQDLKFTNDTGKWLLLRTFVGSGSLTVNLYGTPQDRRVESIAQPLREIAAAPLKQVADPTMEKGSEIVESYGQPSRTTSVTRIVRSPSGAVLHEDTWYSSYRSEPKIVRVGTKPKPKPVPKAEPKPTPTPEPTPEPTPPPADEAPPAKPGTGTPTTPQP
jgi:vancomycin resistance protein YoaR